MTQIKATIHSIPGDKSISHRAIIIGSLATNTSTFHRFLCSEDCLNTASIFQACGVPIAIDKEAQTVTIKGVGLSGLAQPLHTLDVGNSGTGIRLISGILAGQPFSSTISGDESIQRRPMKRIITPLYAMNAAITGNDSQGEVYPPLTIPASEGLSAITYTLPVASAQVKSALLFASLYASGTTTIIEPEPCRNHTEVMLEAFGAAITQDGDTITCNGSQSLTNPFSEPIIIPADFSSAAFFIVFALIHPQCELTLTNIGMNPTRCRLIDILKKMGGRIDISDQTMGIEPYATLTVSSSSLTNITISPEDIPYIIDEVPILAIAALFAKDTCTITQASELRVKESDRIKSTVEMITNLGGSATETHDGLIINGGYSDELKPIKTYKDHRIAMSALIAGAVRKQPVNCDDTACIQTSFPNFFDLLESL